MQLSRYFCPVCRDDTTHGKLGMCLTCKTVEAHTKPYKSEFETLQRRSDARTASGRVQ